MRHIIQFIEDKQSKKTSFGELWQAGLSSRSGLGCHSEIWPARVHRWEAEATFRNEPDHFKSWPKHFQRKSNIRQACPFCSSGLWRDEGFRMKKKRKVLCWCILFPADYPTSCLHGQPIGARMLWCWLQAITTFLLMGSVSILSSYHLVDSISHHIKR